MATFISHNPAETAALGELWGREAKPGWVIGLSGELGAGKTQLVKGLARGLEIRARIQSPSFALVHVHHDGRLPLFHVDLYRLETAAQVVAAGLEEYFQPPGVAVVEWCERWPEFAAANLPRPVTAGHDAWKATPFFRRVLIEPLSETERRITYEDFGA